MTVSHTRCWRRIPLYYEAKLLFVIWLWHPQTRGAISLYENTVQPLLSHYEPQIDQFIAEGRGMASDAFSANIGKYVSSPWLVSLMPGHISSETTGCSMLCCYATSE